MYKKLRKKLDSNWIKANGVWDIVVYGSYARGKESASDIDIAIILPKVTSAGTKLILCQQIRKMLADENYKIDAKAADIKDMQNTSFLAREGIIAEGYSLLKNKPFAAIFGFSAFTLVEYSFKNIAPAKQKMFYYALQGRKKGRGMLARFGGRILSKGILEVPTAHYEKLKSLIDSYGINYKATPCLQYSILH